MAGSVNKVIATMSVATSESWKDKTSGERKTKSEWHRVVIFNPHLADIAEKYLRKGSKVYVEGQLATRKWTGNDGVDKYTTEVVLQKFRGNVQMLDKREDGPPPATVGTQSAAPPSPPATNINDEIPF